MTSAERPTQEVAPRCDALGLCVLLKGHEGKHETNYERVSEASRSAPPAAVTLTEDELYFLMVRVDERQQEAEKMGVLDSDQSATFRRTLWKKLLRLRDAAAQPSASSEGDGLLRELDELLEKATPGPWRDAGYMNYGHDDVFGCNIEAGDEGEYADAITWAGQEGLEGSVRKHADAALIVWLRNHADTIRRLLREG